MRNIEYTTVDRVLAKLSRDLRGTDLNEADVVEWIGEALSFLRVYPSEEQVLAFLEVSNHETDLPLGLQQILQVARNNAWDRTSTGKCGCPTKVVNEINENPESATCDRAEYKQAVTVENTGPVTACGPVVTDCQGKLLGNVELAYYRPYFDLNYAYSTWSASSVYRRNFTPVRLANHKFMGAVVAREKQHRELYQNCADEYTIVGTTQRKLRFSFREGQVAVPYTRTALDPETGYPLIPDNASHLSAITYYIKWKLAEVMEWSGREGYARLAQKSEQQWLKYVKQARSALKMPSGLDQHQNLLEASHQLVPNHRRYFNFFGNLGRAENRGYMDLDRRNY